MEEKEAPTLEKVVNENAEDAGPDTAGPGKSEPEKANRINMSGKDYKFKDYKLHLRGTGDDARDDVIPLNTAQDNNASPDNTSQPHNLPHNFHNTTLKLFIPDHTSSYQPPKEQSHVHGDHPPQMFMDLGQEGFRDIVQYGHLRTPRDRLTELLKWQHEPAWWLFDHRVRPYGVRK